LSAVFVDVRHVKIVDKEREDLVGRKTVSLTDLLLDLSFDALLEIGSVSETVEFDGSVYDFLWLAGSEEASNDCGFTSTSRTNEQYSSLCLYVLDHEVIQPDCLDGWNEDLAGHDFFAFCRRLVFDDLALPFHSFTFFWVEVVIKRRTCVGNLGFKVSVLHFPGLDELFKLRVAILGTFEGSFDTPHTSEAEERFIGEFLLLVFLHLLDDRQVVLQEGIDNSAGSLNAAHLDDRSDTFHLGKLSIFTEELGEEGQED
jgi:hypothetical protein